MYPKVLIISRGVWDDTKGTSSTLTNLFQDYDAERLAHIYIESTMPNTSCCYHFFQISEFSLVHKLYKWRTKTGYTIDTRIITEEPVDKKIVDREASTMDYVRGHRSMFFSYLRELLWLFNGWKSKELKQFIKEFDPDVIWMDGSTLPLMYRLYNHVLKIAQKPATIFMQDDVYTYGSCSRNFWAKVRRWRLRCLVQKVVRQCDSMFVASPKMKKEYDAIFGFNSIFIAKSVDADSLSQISKEVHSPIRLVYLGQVIYGRIHSLISIAEALKIVNKDSIKIQLYVYTNNQLSEDERGKLLLKDSVFLMPPVSYSEVSRVMKENDVVVFVESFEPQFCNVARLSFSTKICDYMSSGKCTLAIGPRNIAPIEYFIEEDAAIVAVSKEEIITAINKLSDKEVVEKYINQAKECAKRNHNRARMNGLIYGKLVELANKNQNECNIGLE